MALIQKFDSSDLYHLAARMGRGDQFGYAGWRAIGEYLEQLSDDLGEDIEVGIIAICCEYSSADSVEKFWKEYGKYSSIDADEWEQMSDAEKLKAVEDYLNERTGVVLCEEDCIIWQTF